MNTECSGELDLAALTCVSNVIAIRTSAIIRSPIMRRGSTLIQAEFKVARTCDELIKSRDRYFLASAIVVTRGIPAWIVDRCARMCGLTYE